MFSTSYLIPSYRCFHRFDLRCHLWLQERQCWLILYLQEFVKYAYIFNTYLPFYQLFSSENHQIGRVEITWSAFAVQVLCKYQMNSECYILGLEILKATLCFSIWLNTHYIDSSIFIMYSIIKRKIKNILLIKVLFRRIRKGRKYI